MKKEESSVLNCYLASGSSCCQIHIPESIIHRDHVKATPKFVAPDEGHHDVKATSKFVASDDSFL